MTILSLPLGGHAPGLVDLCGASPANVPCTVEVEGEGPDPCRARVEMALGNLLLEKTRTRLKARTGERTQSKAR